MTQKEYEDRIGREVTIAEYASANAAYMAAGDDMDKDRFCKLYKTVDGLRELVGILSGRVSSFQRSLADSRGNARDHGAELMWLCEQVRKGVDSSDGMDAISRHLMGDREYLRVKLSDKDLTLTESDREMLAGLL